MASSSNISESRKCFRNMEEVKWVDHLHATVSVDMNASTFKNKIGFKPRNPLQFQNLQKKKKVSTTWNSND